MLNVCPLVTFKAKYNYVFKWQVTPRIVIKRVTVEHCTPKIMLGCFKLIWGQIWANPAVGLNLLIAFLNPTFGFVHIWPKIALTTQHFLECGYLRIYAFNRSAIVCQVLFVLLKHLYCFFLHIIYVSLLHKFPLEAVAHYAKSMSHAFCPFLDRWFCDRLRALFKNAVNVHLSKLYTPDLTYPRVLILAQQTCNGLSQDQTAIVQLSWLS